MIIDERMIAFVQSLDKGNTQFLTELEEEAIRTDVPIIRPAMQSLMRFLLKLHRPARILEVGTAIGFSAILMAEYGPRDCHITTIEKQDLEERFWELCKGGRIQYVRYNLSYNRKAMLTYIERAMKKGFYEGVNLSLAYCDDCGHEELEMDVCPVCGSENLTKIDRMNGYLSYSRVHGDTRLNEAKMAEIAERKSM